MNVPVWLSAVMLFTIIMLLVVPGMLVVASLLTVKRASTWVSALLVAGSCVALLCVLPTIWIHPVLRPLRPAEHTSVQMFQSIRLWTTTVGQVGWFLFAIGFVGLVLQKRTELQNKAPAADATPPGSPPSSPSARHS